MLRLDHLVADFNGTLACDGTLLPGAHEALHRLAARLSLHVVTADTFGTVGRAMAGIDCRLEVLSPGAQDAAKLRYVEKLGAGRCVCIGNGRNDRAMMRAAALAIAVVQQEGACVETMVAADIVTSGIRDALDLLIHPQRIVATLRC